MIVRARFSHGLETPVGGGCSHYIDQFIVKFTEGAIRRLAAERGAMDLHEWG
jgi:hypothetical protein